jgi:hypothetical protein
MQHVTDGIHCTSTPSTVLYCNTHTHTTSPIRAQYIEHVTDDVHSISTLSMVLYCNTHNKPHQNADLALLQIQAEKKRQDYAFQRQLNEKPSIYTRDLALLQFQAQK